MERQLVCLATDADSPGSESAALSRSSHLKPVGKTDERPVPRPAATMVAEMAGGFAGLPSDWASGHLGLEPACCANPSLNSPERGGGCHNKSRPDRAATFADLAAVPAPQRPPSEDEEMGKPRPPAPNLEGGSRGGLCFACFVLSWIHLDPGSCSCLTCLPSHSTKSGSAGTCGNFWKTPG